MERIDIDAEPCPVAEAKNLVFSKDWFPSFLQGNSLGRWSAIFLGGNLEKSSQVLLAYTLLLQNFKNEDALMIHPLLRSLITS